MSRATVCSSLNCTRPTKGWRRNFAHFFPLLIKWNCSKTQPHYQQPRRNIFIFIICEHIAFSFQYYLPKCFNVNVSTCWLLKTTDNTQNLIIRTFHFWLSKKRCDMKQHPVCALCIGIYIIITVPAQQRTIFHFHSSCYYFTLSNQQHCRHHFFLVNWQIDPQTHNALITNSELVCMAPSSLSSSSSSFFHDFHKPYITFFTTNTATTTVALFITKMNWHFVGRKATKEKKRSATLKRYVPPSLTHRLRICSNSF